MIKNSDKKIINNFKKSIIILYFLMVGVIVVAQSPIIMESQIRFFEQNNNYSDTISHSAIKPFYQHFSKDSNIVMLKFIPIYEAFGGLNKTSTLDSIFKTANYLINFGIDINFNIKNKLNINYLPRFYFYHIFDNLLLNDSCAVGKDKMGLNSVENYLFSKNYFNFTMSNTINITYQPYDFLKLELANSKNFYGDGYRSLFLSENAKNYPFLKIETEFAFIKYSFVFAILNTWAKNTNNNYQFIKKYSSFHFLDIAIGKKLNFGIFESVTSKKLTFDYINPLVFFRPVEYSIDGNDNIQLGVNLKYNFIKNNLFYCQILIDDIIVGQFINDIKHRIKSSYIGEYGWFANKWAFQIGFKSYNFCNIEKLDYLAEINVVRPYVYSHSSVYENFTHGGQALAHPLGANFIELVSLINYENQYFRFNFKRMYAITGKDKTANEHKGQNIFLATMDAYHGDNIPVTSYGNVLLQGEKTAIIVIQPEFSYFVKNKKSLSVNLGYFFRYERSKTYKNSINFIYLGIRSNISKFEMLY